MCVRVHFDPFIRDFHFNVCMGLPGQLLPDAVEIRIGLCYLVIWAYMFEFNKQFAADLKTYLRNYNSVILYHLCIFLLRLALRGDTRSAVETLARGGANLCHESRPHLQGGVCDLACDPVHSSCAAYQPSRGL